MTIVQLSNLFNILTYLHPNIQSYHMGYPEDLGWNQDTNFDADIEKGKMFPHLLFLPPEGRMSVKELSTTVAVDLRLYTLRESDNTGEVITDTLAEVWRDLQKWILQILREVSKGRIDSTGVRVFTLGEVEWYMDTDVVIDRLVVVGARFEISMQLDCDDIAWDYNSLPAHLPEPVEDDDYEIKRAAP